VNKSTLLTLALFVLATAVYTMTIPGLGQMRQERGAEQISYFIEVPPQLAKIGSLEFKGIVADYLMLQAMTFMGERIGEKRDLSPEEWQHLHRLLTKITIIDPAFWDPYVLAETMLAWQAGMVAEANQLLLQAAEHRPWDYRPYYFLGFNHFYFQKNADKAASYLRKAAKIPGAPYYLQGLAARFSLYGNETETAVLFLADMLRETTDPAIRLYLAKRLDALRIIHDLEQTTLAFKAQKGRPPKHLGELVEAGLLTGIPKDPYGGEFFLLENGQVYTTSKLVAPHTR